MDITIDYRATYVDGIGNITLQKPGPHGGILFVQAATSRQVETKLTFSPRLVRNCYAFVMLWITFEDSKGAYVIHQPNTDNSSMTKFSVGNP